MRAVSSTSSTITIAAFSQLSFYKIKHEGAAKLSSDACMLPTNNNYLLLNASKTSFYKKYNINALPRYLLFDKEGKIINENTPPPSEVALSTLLDKLIYK